MNRDFSDFDQSRELEYIRKHSFNRFDGAQITCDLNEYPTLWDKAWMSSGRPGNWDDDNWIPDSIYIVATDADKASRLIELGAEWCADGGLQAWEQKDGSWIVSGWWD